MADIVKHVPCAHQSIGPAVELVWCGLWQWSAVHSRSNKSNSSAVRLVSSVSIECDMHFQPHSTSHCKHTAIVSNY